ncbi:ErmE/ErmH/ErmO/ErmR family 23S rRNA (adenine(2058)-N(6))-methyltransferase [Streptomyces capparidis]
MPQPPHPPAPARPAPRSRRAELSQNFLRDPRTIDRVVRAARLDPGDLVLEPGAGEGRLTRALALRCRRVTAYEIDPRLAAALAERFRGERRVGVVPGDFLAARPPREPFAVVGNIPFSATADIVAWCLAAPGLTAATLITQWEYARKRTGGHGRWSRLTVRTWPRFGWHLAGRIDRGLFRPVPRVDAAVLRIERRRVPLLDAGLLPAWEALVDLGFTGVGGSLYASLRQRHPGRKLAAAFARAGVPRDTVVAFVTPGQWLGIFTALHGGAADGRGGGRG